MKVSRWYLGPMHHSALENAWAYHMPAPIKWKSRKVIGEKGRTKGGGRLYEIARKPKNSRLMSLIRLVSRLGLGSNL